MEILIYSIPINTIECQDLRAVIFCILLFAGKEKKIYKYAWNENKRERGRNFFFFEKIEDANL